MSQFQDIVNSIDIGDRIRIGIREHRGKESYRDRRITGEVESVTTEAIKIRRKNGTNATITHLIDIVYWDVKPLHDETESRELPEMLPIIENDSADLPISAFESDLPSEKKRGTLKETLVPSSLPAQSESMDHPPDSGSVEPVEADSNRESQQVFNGTIYRMYYNRIKNYYYGFLRDRERNERFFSERMISDRELAEQLCRRIACIKIWISRSFLHRKMTRIDCVPLKSKRAERSMIIKTRRFTMPIKGNSPGRSRSSNSPLK